MNRVIGGVFTGLAVIGLVGFAARCTAGGDPTDSIERPAVQVMGTSIDAPDYVEIDPDPPASPPATTTSTPDPATTIRVAPMPVADPPAPITIAFTGDVIAHVAVADSARIGSGSYDFAPMFERIAPVLAAADLAICHLETPLDPESLTPRGFPRFSAPAEMARALAGAGFDGCSTSSNHVLDRGIRGVGQTLDVLDAAGLEHTGSARAPEERAGVLYQAGEVTVGHTSYSYAVSGWLRSDQQWVANGLDEEQILADARDLRDRGAEFVVVSLHWGIEHRYTPTAAQTRLGEALMASPLIDLIVGHHAHILQPIQQIDDKYLFYGLGNFLSNQEPGCCGEVAQESAIMLVRLVEVEGRWVAEEVRYVPTWVDRHRDHVILPTLSWDVPDHRHAAWLQRSAIRVGQSLQLDEGAMSIVQACAWMGSDCSTSIDGAD